MIASRPGPACIPAPPPVPRGFGLEPDEALGYDRSRRFINALYPARGRLLQIGCGFGFLLAAFARDGWRAHGIDPLADRCEYARERHGAATHSVRLAETSIPADAFDVVILSRDLTDWPDAAATLSQIHRILRPGGHVLLDVFAAAAEPLDRAWTAIGFRTVRSVRPAAFFTAAQLAEKLAARDRRPRLRRAAGEIVRRLGVGHVTIRVSRPGRERVLLQKISGGTDIGAPPGVASRAMAGPDWLTREAAGIITARTLAPAPAANIRRGFPWREPQLWREPQRDLAARAAVSGRA